MATLPGKVTDGIRPADDTLLLRRQLGQWQHRNIADEQALERALRRWPLLAELADPAPLSDRQEADV